MELLDIVQRVWLDLTERPSGPLALRFVVQPAVAALLALRDGARDGRSDGPLFLVGLVTGTVARGPLLRGVVRRIGRLLLIALTLDVTYQVIVFGVVYPGEALLVALLFGFLPYALSRELVARFVRIRRRRGRR